MRGLFLKARFIIPRGADSGHSEQLRTDTDLELGPAPNRIDRPISLSRGLTGPRVNSFPMTAGMEYIGHVPLVQLRRGPSMHPGNAIDDRAAIPAVYAGNPVE